MANTVGVCDVSLVGGLWFEDHDGNNGYNGKL